MTPGGLWGEPAAVAGEVPADEGWSGPTVRSSNTPPVQDHSPENEIKRNCIELSPVQINRNSRRQICLRVESIYLQL